tara:strand:+ start:1452 stop:2069 length:618 start_codon:yes stop_codon:yes gene_type:complete
MSLIYKIYCKDENIKECYVGSTNNLHKRKIKHKSDCNNLSCKSYNLKVYQFIRSNGGWDNFDFMILEQFENIMTKQDLLKIEGQYIKNNNTTLNSQIASRTKKEYKEENIIKIQEYKQEYYKKNKEKLLEQKKIYRQDNKEKFSEYRKNNKEKQNEYNKQYYENIKEKLKEKVECEFCKSLIRKDGLKRHQRSKKCLKVQNTNQN